MTRGLYRTELGSVMVEHDNNEAPLSNHMYVVAGYQPSYEELPSWGQYNLERRRANAAAMEDEIRKFRETHKPEGLRGVWRLLGLN